MKPRRRELALTCTCIGLTLTAGLLTVVGLARQGLVIGLHDPERLLAVIAFGLIVLALLYGGLVYQFARAGYFWRLARPVSETPPPGDIDARAAKPLTVLVPSYKEEPGVLRLTLLSAALMEYPNRNIVALLDDPPTGSPSEMEALEAAREIVRDLQVEFAAYAAYFVAAEQRFGQRLKAGPIDADAEALGLAALYRQAARWIETRLDSWLSDSAGAPADGFFSDKIARRLIEEHRARAARLSDAGVEPAAIAGEYRRLVSLFKVEIVSFERKRYANLSHAPNKAMNLNAYIGLIGGAYRSEETTDGRILIPCARAQAQLVVPHADYLLTLDADSMVLPDYAMKLSAILDEEESIAVAQTPYSAFPGAESVLERVAGATTDLQYIAHQGSTAFGATYWVGANAMLRWRALVEIRQDCVERGHTVPIFIQDRTVIEDTGSTIDLIRRGWSLHNHPERLAYSATPADFGALAIQRRRWSNGGLIILPDLVRHSAEGGPGRPRLGEVMMRLQYLVSPLVANLGLLILLLVPFDIRLAGVWLPLSAAPYYFLYARDLKQSGYRLSDLARVYALNLMLLPVNLAGVGDSIRQIISGRKTAFARTPKIGGRTSTPVSYIVSQLALTGCLAVAGVIDLVSDLGLHAAFAAINLSLFVYGFSRFVGWRAAAEDLSAWWASVATRSSIATERPAAEPVAIVAPTFVETVLPPERARAAMD